MELVEERLDSPLISSSVNILLTWRICTLVLVLGFGVWGFEFGVWGFEYLVLVGRFVLVLGFEHLVLVRRLVWELMVRCLP